MDSAQCWKMVGIMTDGEELCVSAVGLWVLREKFSLQATSLYLQQLADRYMDGEMDAAVNSGPAALSV